MKKTEVVLDSIRLFHWDDLMPLSFDCGFSYYKGVIVFWNSDYDKRIIKMIDKIEHFHGLYNLLATRQTKGIVSLLWKDELSIPADYKERIEGEDYCWNVCNVHVGLE